jgi:hypothetical protein
VISINPWIKLISFSDIQLVDWNCIVFFGFYSCFTYGHILEISLLRKYKSSTTKWPTTWSYTTSYTCYVNLQECPLGILCTDFFLTPSFICKYYSVLIVWIKSESESETILELQVNIYKAKLNFDIKNKGSPLKNETEPKLKDE